MGPSTFDTEFEKSGKFYVRNDILKFFILTLRRSNQGQVFKKRSEAVCLNAFILFLALPRNNDVDVISSVSFGVLVYRESLVSHYYNNSNDGQLNRHNSHYWSNQNPHWHIPVDHQNRWTSWYDMA